jgi:hypothetical protein
LLQAFNSSTTDDAMAENSRVKKLKTVGGEISSFRDGFRPALPHLCTYYDNEKWIEEGIRTANENGKIRLASLPDLANRGSRNWLHSWHLQCVCLLRRYRSREELVFFLCRP